jgi:translation initiation factor 2 subunit 2
MADYEKLLEEAYAKVQAPKGNGERFEVPKVEGKYEGKKTILTNFNQILSQIRRPQEHFQKFLSKELATPAFIEGERLLLNKKVSREKVDQKIEEYIKEFVQCKECKKPDTEIIKDTEHRMEFLHCLACGAKHAVHKI